MFPVLLPFIIFGFSLCLQPLSNAYHELAQVYTTNNPAELRSLVNKHSETFTRDNNTGLVKQCLSSLYKKNIQRLTKVRSASESVTASVKSLHSVASD